MHNKQTGPSMILVNGAWHRKATAGRLRQTAPQQVLIVSYPETIAPVPYLLVDIQMAVSLTSQAFLNM